MFSPCSRLLQLGVCNAELYANLGLSCFYAQQYDMALNCFNKALALASDENAADIWYNIGHVALVRGCVCVCVCVCVVLYGYVNLCAFVLCVYSMCVLAEDLVLYASKVQRCAHTCVCLVL